jgi:TM2 domain-containing membrane protein YozV
MSELVDSTQEAADRETPETPPALPSPPAEPTPVEPKRTRRQPIVAVLLSVFPGLGQVYNGQIVKALVFFCAWAGSIWLTADGEWLFGLAIPFVYLFNLVDAYRSAALSGPLPLQPEAQTESPAWGVGLIAIGLLFLLNNLGWLRLAALRRYWPLLLIAAGVAFLWSALRRRSGESDVPRP